MKFENVYWDWPTMQSDGRYPSILAIGDSWFWFPFPGGSLLHRLGRIVAPKQHCILAQGNNGAEAWDYVHGKYAKSVRTALAQHGADLSAVFISGGGNDFAGFNDLRPLLNQSCTGAASAPECFRDADAERSLEWLMRKLSEAYRMLIGQALASSNPTVKVFLHNYDFAIPSGRGIFGPGSSWLKQALDDAQVPSALQHECMKHLIRRLTQELHSIAAAFPSRVFVVDSSGTLAPGDWADELHPTPEGFRKIGEKWRPLLAAQGLA